MNVFFSVLNLLLFKGNLQLVEDVHHYSRNVSDVGQRTPMVGLPR